MLGMPLFGGFKGTLCTREGAVGAADMLIRLRRDFDKLCISDSQSFCSLINGQFGLSFALSCRLLGAQNLGLRLALVLRHESLSLFPDLRCLVFEVLLQLQSNHYLFIVMVFALLRKSFF